ncbi:MarR family winged helix-turn-helix transcriptional regulator [Actinomadura hibisca]|uniref:MarR family winged helix-turn-helix transcriptional regulator n=1 Tax=Actinomadura hibisca TaxID=68565 RepID=UPI00082ADD22|nr:MarR family transcriptional regulator [Actinomadura hibisca]
MAASRGTRPPSEDVEELAAALDGPVGTLTAVWATRHLHAPVPVTQLRVLFVVERHGRVNVTGIAEELDALLSSASRLCGRLEATGMLERAPAPDRRAIMWRLTPQGAGLLARLRQERLRDLAEVLETMSATDRAALLTVLRRFDEAAAGREDGRTTPFSMPA